MARPLRRLWSERPRARRRHRTWMFSMCMATIGWSAIWIDLFLVRFAPDHAPSLSAAAWFASVFAAAGILAAVWGFRARLAWLLFLSVPVLANGTLLAAPWVLRSLVVISTHDAAPAAERDGRAR